MPDYEMRLWDARSFDFGSVPFVREAIQVKKWAFAADYIRLHALYHEGGVYLDTDVRVLRRFDEFLKYSFFTSHEIHPFNFNEVERSKLDRQQRPVHQDMLINGLNVQAAIMGGAKGNVFIKECLDFYNGKHLIGEDGKASCEEFVIGPHMSKTAEKYGYRYNDSEQQLQDDMIILKPEIFVGNTSFLTERSYAVHLCNGSWKERSGLEHLKYRTRNHYPKLFPVVDLCCKVTRSLKKLSRL